jgi:RecJ-like exonuclease
MLPKLFYNYNQNQKQTTMPNLQSSKLKWMDLDDNNDEPDTMCNSCNGTGEGSTPDTWCWSCGGSGAIMPKSYDYEE